MPDELTADDIRRGAARALQAAGHAVLCEVPLATGRRADLVALDRQGCITIVEIKTCRADFMADRKWREYLDFCDLFYFATGPRFPREILPVDEGLILADRYAGEITREARPRPLAGARRKAMLVRFACTAAARLQSLLDPLE